MSGALAPLSFPPIFTGDPLSRTLAALPGDPVAQPCARDQLARRCFSETACLSVCLDSLDADARPGGGFGRFCCARAARRLRAAASTQSWWCLAPPRTSEGVRVRARAAPKSPRLRARTSATHISHTAVQNVSRALRAEELFRCAS